MFEIFFRDSAEYFYERIILFHYVSLTKKISRIS